MLLTERDSDGMQLVRLENGHVIGKEQVGARRFLWTVNILAGCSWYAWRTGTSSARSRWVAPFGCFGCRAFAYAGGRWWAAVGLLQ